MTASAARGARKQPRDPHGGTDRSRRERAQRVAGRHLGEPTSGRRGGVPPRRAPGGASVKRAAGDVDDLAGDEPGLLGHEEGDRRGDVLGLARPAGPGIC